jgi:hypothetical protein
MYCVSCISGVLRNLGVGDEDSPEQSQGGSFAPMARTLTGELYICIKTCFKMFGC